MSWQEQLDKAVAAIKDAAESEQARNFAAKAKTAATNLAQKVRQGAVSAADTFVEANRDPASMALRYINADATILSVTVH